MLFDLNLADVLAFAVPAIPVAVLIWFFVCLVRKLSYRGNDPEVIKKRNFWLWISGALALVLGGAFLALIVVFIMAIAHM